MAGQGIERREVLRMLAIAAGVATFSGFSKWHFACEHAGNTLAQVRPATYQPLFFTAPEYALLERLTEIIMPSDETPGAREAGVSEFIDLMVSRDDDLQHNFHNGLGWLEARSQSAHRKPFLSLSSDQQTTMLETLAYKAKFQGGDEAGQQFFRLLRKYTVMGFYTTEIGLRELDFPGLKFYADSPACPHRDDPEHRNLPPPKW